MADASVKSRQDHEQDNFLAMVHEFKKIQAAMVANASKPSVILTDQTDLGDKMAELGTKLVAAIQDMDGRELSQEQITAIGKLQMSMTALATQIQSAQRQQLDATKQLLAAIKSIAVTPTVNVPQAKVLVQEREIDLTPLKDLFRDRTEPQAEEKPDHCDLSRYRAQDISESDGKQYIGFQNPEGCWYIIENDVQANKMRYLFGSSAYTKHFRQAVSFQYQTLQKAMRALQA